ncbi:general secretion pathway protein GspB [Ramlibacter sp. MMS24-I3-19]|uniref:general secretion pathway protein GspB n=1 Tax=Ramlibacter sp. MMS24-I3-19 TaxID=3416606 RepID=UPI003D09127D
MSYILDALRKADAQRQRTRLPGLQAQPASAPAEATAPVWRSPIAWLLAGGLLVAMLVLAWPGSQQPTPGVAPAVVPSPPVTAATPAPAVASEPPASQTPAPVVATAIEPAPPPPRRIPEPAQRPAARPAPQREPVKTPAQPTTSSAPAASPAPATSSKPAAAESSTPPPGAPKLAITGGVYSADAGQRLLIVGGQVFNEGSEVAPGVRLEQVRPGQAVLSYQGQRFTARY